jgi:hypothetical protein
MSSGRMRGVVVGFLGRRTCSVSSVTTTNQEETTHDGNRHEPF